MGETWITCCSTDSCLCYNLNNHDRSLLGRCFLGFVLSVLEYCSAVWCQAADIHLKRLDRVVSGARFLTGGVYDCDIAYRCSWAVLCMLYKIRCNRCTLLMVHYLDRMCQCGLHEVVWSHIGSLMRFLAAEPRRTCIPFSVFLWNDLPSPVFDYVGLAGFKSRAYAFLLA